MIKLSIIIPAYNEEKNIKKGVLEEVENYLKNLNYLYEVIIVDDRSTDNTASLVEKFINDKNNWRLIKAEHGGKALTVMRGMLEAKGEIVLFTDMDQATPLNQIEKFLPKFNEGYDIVIGSRQGREGAPVIRKLAAWIFSLLRGIILGLPFSDTQCGFKAFNKKSVKVIFEKMMGDWENTKNSGAAVNAGFDVEALFLAKKMGFKTAEVPVEWHYVGTKRVNLLKDSLEAIKDMLRVRLNEINKKYN